LAAQFSIPKGKSCGVWRQKVLRFVQKGQKVRVENASKGLIKDGFEAMACAKS
jgi:hypothetical protein